MRVVNTRHTTAAIALTAAIAAATTACQSDTSSGGSTGSETTGKGFKIGLLLPESKTTRYEQFDKPLIEKHLKELCAKCEVLYQNADQDPSKQESQAESMLTQGVKVLILDSVDAKAAGGIVNQANGQKVPVVAYDRLASGPVKSYVSYDNKSVGQAQGKALLAALKKGGNPKRGPIVMINGAPTDPNAAEYKAGAHSVLDGKVTIGKEYDTPDWSPDKAQDEMEQATTALSGKKIIGVYAANDGMAGGAIAALKGADVKGNPPVTGQDAELAAVQRILAGQQYMTVYKAIDPEAKIAAEMAIAAATGKQYEGKTIKKNNGKLDVPSVLLPPQPVTKSQIGGTVIKDKFYTAAKICTKAYKTFCTKAGIK